MSKRSMADVSMTLRRGTQSPRDRTFINEWKAPLPSTVPSSHDEEAQLDAMEKQLAAIEKELQDHKDLQSPMNALYQPRSTNSKQAQTNWENKSQYLLAEHVKYHTYVESLKAAMALRLKRRGEKAMEKALSSAVNSKDLVSNTQDQSEDTEEDEPQTPMAAERPIEPRSKQHRRETAEDDIGDD